MSQGENAKQGTYGTSILKAARILDYLGNVENGDGVSNIAREVGINRATVFKLLETLQQLNYVTKDQKTSSYRLGMGLVKLAHAALHQIDLATAAKPLLKQLNDETGETIHLGILDNKEVVYVDKLESTQAIRMYSQVGKPAPLYCTGIGKALMSRQSSQWLENYLATVDLRRYTDNTITTQSELRQEIERIRKDGYAMDNGEHEGDVRCIAVPIYNNGELFGAVSISAPSYRFGDDKLQEYIPKVHRAAQAIADRCLEGQA